VAIIGRSGAGKSSLMGVLLGWHRLASGRLCVDGAETGEAQLASFRRHIAWVDPAVQIWNKSFLENLNYSSEDGDFARSAGALDAADLRGVLQKLPQGLQTRLGEGGGLLSGGEGQRMRLARALAQSNVRLALLDEPFRGLDREQRSALLASTRRHWDGVTLLCATHDVSETLLFDRVLVIEDGKIIEDDDPNRLARTPSRFHDLLEAERLVRDGIWAGRQWRRIHVHDGRVESVDATPIGRMRA
jgi:ATP-binding cassette subfamily B protein